MRGGARVSGIALAVCSQCIPLQDDPPTHLFSSKISDGMRHDWAAVVAREAHNWKLILWPATHLAAITSVLWISRTASD
jgi:hypothetical protein